jgi:dephospho-CoA kinase
MATNNPKHAHEQSDLRALRGQIPLIGLTGGIGSGKTAVSALLGKLGAGIIDTDVIAHQITAPQGSAIPLIQKTFGSKYITADGALDRNQMRTLVFKDPSARKALENITHPLIRELTIEQAFQLANKGASYLVFVVPLLLESGNWLGLIDHLVVLDCLEEDQIERVMQRSNLSRQEVERILTAQTSREERLNHADTVINNQGTLEDLEAEVNHLHQKILQIQKDQLSSS